MRIYEPTTELALDDLKDQEDEQEEEEEEKDEPVLPNPTVEDIAPGLAMLRAQDAFKEHVRRRQLEKHAAGVRRQAPDFVTTSDCQEAIEDIVQDAQMHADFAVELNTKIYVNKRLLQRKNLPETTRDSLDLADLEETIWQQLNAATIGDDVSLLKQTAFVRAGSHAGGARTHDFEDFGLETESQIQSMLAASRQEHPRSKIQLTIEVRAQSQPSKKRKTIIQASSPARDTSEVPSSPPVAQAKKKTRTGRLETQAEIRLEKIQLAGDFHKQLASRYKCDDKGCTNQENFCFIDFQDRKIHYSITHVQQSTWAQAISRGEATLANPPISIWEFWKKDGGVSRESRTSGRQTFQQETR